MKAYVTWCFVQNTVRELFFLISSNIFWVCFYDYIEDKCNFLGLYLFKHLLIFWKFHFFPEILNFFLKQ